MFRRSMHRRSRDSANPSPRQPDRANNLGRPVGKSAEPIDRNTPGPKRVKGIEPSYSAWKAAALPLCYTRDLQPQAGQPARATCPRRWASTGIERIDTTDDAITDGLIQWGLQDSNLRRHSQRIYSPSPLTTRTNPQIVQIELMVSSRLLPV